MDGAAANLAESVARKLHKLRPPVVVAFLESLLASGRRDEQLMGIVADFVASQVGAGEGLLCGKGRAVSSGMSSWLLVCRRSLDACSRCSGWPAAGAAVLQDTCDAHAAASRVNPRRAWLPWRLCTPDPTAPPAVHLLAPLPPPPQLCPPPSRHALSCVYMHP